MATLEEAFGEDFARSFKIGKIKQAPRLRLEGAIKREVIKAVKERLKPDSPILNQMIGNNLYHIALIEAEDTLNRYQFQKGGGMSIKWFRMGDKRISLITEEATVADFFEENQHYIVVGMLKTKPAEGGRVWHNFRLDGVISMDEIANFDTSGEELE